MDLHLEHLGGLPLGQCVFGRRNSDGLDLQRMHSVDAAMSFYTHVRPETWRFDRFRRRRRRAFVMSRRCVFAQGADRAVDCDARDDQENYRRYQNVSSIGESLSALLAL